MIRYWQFILFWNIFQCCLSTWLPVPLNLHYANWSVVALVSSKNSELGSLIQSTPAFQSSMEPESVKVSQHESAFSVFWLLALWWSGDLTWPDLGVPCPPPKESRGRLRLMWPYTVKVNDKWQLSNNNCHTHQSGVSDVTVTIKV